MPKNIAYAAQQAMPLPPIARFLMGAAVKVAQWEMNMRTRNALEKLDDHQLLDIGLTRGQAREEWDKPFWWA